MENAKKLAAQLVHVVPLMIRTVKGDILKASEGRLTRAQFRILADIFNENGQVSISQLALEHGVSQPSISKMVDLLVKKGFLLRSPSKSDRRQMDLAMTQKGAKAIIDLESRASKSLAIKLKKLTVNDQKILLQHLEQVQKILKKMHKDNV